MNKLKIRIYFRQCSYPNRLFYKPFTWEKIENKIKASLEYYEIKVIYK